MIDSCESSPTSVLQAGRPRLVNRVAEGFEFFRLGARLVHKHSLAVIREFPNGFENVGQCSVATVLVGGLVIGLREPLLGELFDGRDIDVSVVQVFMNLGQVFLQEHPVGANGVARQWGALGVWDKTGDVLKNLGARVLQTETGVKFLEKPTGGVHLADKITHLLKCGRRGLNDDLKTIIHRGEFVISDDHGDFDELVNSGVKACHLTVDPDQKGIRGTSHSGSLSGERCASEADDVDGGEAEANQGIDDAEPRERHGDQQSGDPEAAGGQHHHHGCGLNASITGGEGDNRHVPCQRDQRDPDENHRPHQGWGSLHAQQLEKEAGSEDERHRAQAKYGRAHAQCVSKKIHPNQSTREANVSHGAVDVT